MQHYMLCTFRKVLISAPALLKSFREEGLWDLIFSEKFFYFGSSLDYIQQNDQLIDAPKSIDSKSFSETDVNVLQAEAISFLEFAATLNENSNNLVSPFSPALDKSISNSYVNFSCLNHRFKKLLNNFGSKKM
jgi:hypothetical protein